MNEITDIKQYIHLINEALIEIEEMEAAIEFDNEYMEMSLHAITPIKIDLQTLKKSLSNGTHQFGGDDLPYMRYVESAPNEIIPFKYLLKVINQIHKTAQL